MTADERWAKSTKDHARTSRSKSAFPSGVLMAHAKLRKIKRDLMIGALVETAEPI